MAQAAPTTNPSTASAPALTRVLFHGDYLDATKDAQGKIWVSVSRVCEALGLGYSSQLQKLKTKPWATVTLIVMVANDGKTREVACLDLDSLPMWLATIDTRRVRGAVREKLVIYQKECAQVLRELFLGQRPEPAAPKFQESSFAAWVLGKSENFDDVFADPGPKPIGDMVQLALGARAKVDEPLALQVLSDLARQLWMLQATLDKYFDDTNGRAYLRDDEILKVVGSMADRAYAVSRIHGTIENANDFSRVRSRLRGDPKN